MRMLRRIAVICLVLMLVMTQTLAEAPFLRHAADWTLADTPLDVRLSAELSSHMPFDDDRLAMLTELTSQISLRLTATRESSSVGVYVGNTEAVTMSTQGDAVQFSVIPDTAYVSEAAAELLLGSDPAADLSPFGLRGDAEALLDDGWVLLNAIDPAFEEYADRRSVKTNITDMGTARSCTDYTIPKADAEQFGELLLSLCPEGWLHDIITSLTFSGKQTLRIYRTEDEVPLRMEYNGVCGAGEDLRTVKLVWRCRRDDTAHRDEVTLTSPAKKGSNKNSLDFERVIKTNKKGAVEMDGSFTWTVTADKKTTTTKGSFELVNTFTDEKDVVTGEVTLQQKLPGESSYRSVILAPDMTIAGSEEEPLVTGSITVKEKAGGNVTEQAVIHLTLGRAFAEPWMPCSREVNLDEMTAEELAALQQLLSARITTAVVKPLILLLEDGADWFFRDMPEDAVQQIVDAAGSAIVID